MNGKLKKEAIKLLIVQCSSVFSASFLFSTYTLFLLNRGVNLFQIGLINVVFSLGIIIFQIPTGALADIWGRKKTYLLSVLVLAFSFFMYLISKNFAGFMLAEILWAFATALASGCLDAHVWESIEEVGKTTGLCDKEIETSNKRLSVWISVAAGALSAIGGFIGANMAAKNFALPWLFATILTFVSFFVALKLLKDDKPRKISFVEDVKKMGKASFQSVNISLGNQNLMSLLVLTFLMRLSLTGVFNFWEPRAAQLNGNKIAIFGLVWVLVEMACSIGSFLGEKLTNRLGESRTIFSLLPGLAVFVVGMIFAYNFWMLIILMLLLQVLTSIKEYAFQIKKQKDISALGYDSENSLRATILSVNSIAGSLGSSIGLLVAGFVANKVSIQSSWGISFFAIMLTFVYMVYISERKAPMVSEELVSEVA